MDVVAATAPIVLASASPRRRELLETVRVRVEVEPVDADESRLGSESPTAYVVRVARLKLDVFLSRTRRDDAFVIAADTTVALDGDVLGKPANDAEAVAMLTRLSGRSHEVTTAVAVSRVGTPVVAECVVTTRVRFRALTSDAILAYVETGEGRDKAGSYGIQGIGSGFVESIEGSYTNVVGLPVSDTLAMLLELGALRSWP